MRSRIAWTAVGVLTLTALLALSYWLFMFALVGALGYFAFWKPASLRKAGLGLLGGAAIGLIVLFSIGYVRPTRRIGACEDGPTQRVARFVSRFSPPVPAVSTDTPFEQRLRKSVFENLSRARSTLETDHITDEASAFVDQSRAENLSSDIVDLRSKLGELRAFLNSAESRTAGLNDPAKRRRGEQILETQLQGYAARVKNARSPADQRRLDEEFHKILNDSPYFDLALRLGNIQTLQHRLANADLAASVKPTILFDGGQLIYEEAVTIIASRGELVQIDAEPLQREAGLDQFGYEIRLEQDGQRSTPPDAERVDLTPGSRTATLVSRRTVSVGNRCTSGWRSAIQRLDLRWPSPYVARLAVLTRVPGFGEVHSTVTMNRDVKISEVRIPLWSFLTAKDQVDISRDAGWDVVRFSKDVVQSATAADPYWIEVLGPSRLIRNPIVYKLREYLIAENALMGLATLVLGIAWAKAIGG